MADGGDFIVGSDQLNMVVMDAVPLKPAFGELVQMAAAGADVIQLVFVFPAVNHLKRVASQRRTFVNARLIFRKPPVHFFLRHAV